MLYYYSSMKIKAKEDGWQQFLELCKQLKTAEQFNEFFDLFLTIEERHAIGDRCAIIKELLKGEKTQREMATDLGTSIAKITRGSNYSKTISKNLRKFLQEKLDA